VTVCDHHTSVMVTQKAIEDSRIIMLQLKDLRVDQWIESCIGLIQENLIENSVQDCLPYILKPHGPCQLLLAYPKQPCICLKVNMC